MLNTGARQLPRVLAPAPDRGALGESLAGKDRYEFEKFFAPRTVLTLSVVGLPLYRHAADDSSLKRRHPRHPSIRTSSELGKSRVPPGPARFSGRGRGLLEGFLCQNWTEHGGRRPARSYSIQLAGNRCECDTVRRLLCADCFQRLVDLPWVDPPPQLDGVKPIRSGVLRALFKFPRDIGGIRWLC